MSQGYCEDYKGKKSPAKKVKLLYFYISFGFYTLLLIDVNKLINI